MMARKERDIKEEFAKAIADAKRRNEEGPQPTALIRPYVEMTDADIQDLKDRFSKSSGQSEFVVPEGMEFTAVVPDQYVSDDEIRNWTAHHPPSDSSIIEAHERIRAEFCDLMLSMNGLLPEGPDKTVALRALRDAMMQANSCVAIAQAVYHPIKKD